MAISIVDMMLTLEYRWRPLRDFLPWRFAGRVWDNYRWLRATTQCWPNEALLFAIRLSCKYMVPR